jgi:hypothetical protein
MKTEDIRNRLTPFKNLIALIENGLLHGTVDVHNLITEEIERCKKEIETLSSEETIDVSEGKLNNPHQMLVDSQYKITEPDYDDDATEEPYIVEVVKKTKHGFILRDMKHNFTFERTFQHLMNCEIEEFNLFDSSDQRGMSTSEYDDYLKALNKWENGNGY